MKKFLTAILCFVFAAFGAAGFTACADKKDGDAVNLVSVTAAEAGVRKDIDYFVVPEPAASAKAGAIPSLVFSGSLQALYGDGNGYPQAVVVAKKRLAESAGGAIVSALKDGAEKLLSANAEDMASAVRAHLTDGMTPTFTAKNLTRSVIENCSVKCVGARECKEEVKSFMQKLNSVSEASFGMPSDGFFAEDNGGAVSDFGGSISVFAPDGAPALGLAPLMAEEKTLCGAQVSYNIVDSATIQTYVTGANPKADICVLPVNLAVKLLGSGEKYKMLATLTHGNLYLLSNGKPEATKQSMDILKGRTVGVINLAQVPGLTFKAILKDGGLKFKELR